MMESVHCTENWSKQEGTYYTEVMILYMKFLYQFKENRSYPRMRSLNPSSERFDLAYPNIWTSPDCRNPCIYERGSKFNKFVRVQT